MIIPQFDFSEENAILHTIPLRGTYLAGDSEGAIIGREAPTVAPTTAQDKLFWTVVATLLVESTTEQILGEDELFGGER